MNINDYYESAEQRKEQLAMDHPRCIMRDFTIAYLSK